MPKPDLSIGEESPATQRFHSSGGFAGDDTTLVEFYAEATDRNEVGLHGTWGWEQSDEQHRAIYVDPLAAVQYAEQILTAAREAVRLARP